MKTHATVGAADAGGQCASRCSRSPSRSRSPTTRSGTAAAIPTVAGEEIPIAGRIVAVADVFDALTHVRPYKAAWSKADAIAEITGHAGRHSTRRSSTAFLAGFGGRFAR